MKYSIKDKKDYKQAFQEVKENYNNCLVKLNSTSVYAMADGEKSLIHADVKNVEGWLNYMVFDCPVNKRYSLIEDEAFKLLGSVKETLRLLYTGSIDKGLILRSLGNKNQMPVYCGTQSMENIAKKVKVGFISGVCI